MLHSPQKSIKFVKFHYFSIKKLKSLRSRLSILKAIFGQKPDFDNTNTLGLPWEYCASTLGVLPPVLWEYCLSTLGVLHQYPGTTLGVLCQYSGSTVQVLTQSSVRTPHTPAVSTSTLCWQPHSMGTPTQNRCALLSTVEQHFWKSGSSKTWFCQFFKKIKGSKNAA